MPRLTLLSLAIALNTACFAIDAEDGDTADTSTKAPTTGSTPTPGPSECVPFAEQPTFAESGTVRGRVVSPSGAIAVRGALAQVVADQQVVWSLTNCGGTFEIQLPPGAHDVAISTGRYGAARSVDVAAGEVVDLGDIPLEVHASIAVVFGRYDNVGGLLTEIGVPYTFFDAASDLLADPATLAGFDVVFANCGSTWTTGGDDVTPGQLAGLRSWIEAGGTLYASDWEYELFEGAMPEALDFAANPGYGPVTALDADLLDREIQAILGKEQATLLFNLPEWRVIEDAAPTTEVLVSGNVPGFGDHPLAARAYLGQGKAFYTSFHTESQMTEDMETLLFEMILAL